MVPIADPLMELANLFEISITAGFGLFATLALFRLRSETISKIEISYFFGSIAIAVICSVLGTGLRAVPFQVGPLFGLEQLRMNCLSSCPSDEWLNLCVPLSGPVAV